MKLVGKGLIYRQVKKSRFSKHVEWIPAVTLEVINKNDKMSFLRAAEVSRPDNFMDLLFANPDNLVGVVEQWTNGSKADRDYIGSWHRILRDEVSLHEVPGKLFRNPVKG